MDPADAPAVARIFGESDAGELPHRLGVTRRTLFEFHGLYFHLVESAGDVSERLPAIRDHPLFVDVNTKLEGYVSAYDPQTWRGPRDAMARPFYSWTPD
jgi:cyclase